MHVIVLVYYYTRGKCADYETCAYFIRGSRGEGGGQGVRSPPENHKAIGYRSPERSQSYQASIQYRAIIGPLAKQLRH